MGAGLTQEFTEKITTLSPSDGYGKTQPDGHNVRHLGDNFCLRVVDTPSPEGNAKSLGKIM